LLRFCIFATKIAKQKYKMEFTDTHAHIYSDQFKSDREAMLSRAFDMGVNQLFMPNVDHESIDGMLELEMRYPKHCFPMMGLHPCSVGADFEKELYTVEDWLSKRSFWAIGEMGLDLYWDKTYFEQQKEAFRVQAAWAKRYRKPLVIHSRESTTEALQLLEELKDENLTGVLHCFSGTLAEAQKTIELGFMLGIGGVLTFKKSGLDELVKQIDLKHLVLETDSPYLAPVPHRGKRNECSYIPLIAQKLADIKQISLAEVSRITNENAERLFGKK
jgi:TatD DNase family protein